MKDVVDRSSTSRIENATNIIWMIMIHGDVYGKKLLTESMVSNLNNVYDAWDVA